MRVGIAGHVATEDVAEWLDAEVSSLPKGYDGAPLFRTLIGALLNRGHDISVFTLSVDIPPTVKEPIVVRGDRVTMYYGPHRRRGLRPNGMYPGSALDFFRLEQKMLRKAMMIARPEIIHAHWAYEFGLATMATGLPYVITCHDSPSKVLQYFRDVYRLSRYLMARRVLRKAQRLTAVSPYLRDELQPMATVPIEVVPNPLPPRALELAPRAPRVVNVEVPRIAMVLNGWIELKNPKLGLAAFALLRKAYPNASLQVFGSGYASDGPAASWAKQNGLTDGVSFCGVIPHRELLQTLQSVDVLLHPSLEEAGSMIVTEAIALGLPVVGGERSGAMPWILGDGSAGVLVDVTCPQRMCEGMQKLLSDPEFYHVRSREAASRARAVFNADTVATQYESIYRDVLERTALAELGFGKRVAS